MPFSFQSPGAILCKLGPFTVRYYGAMIALGFLSATFFAVRLAHKWGLSSEKIINMALACFIGGIIGARLYFVALSWSYFSVHPEEIAAVWNGGLSIHGGIIFGVMTAIWYCRYDKLPFLKSTDLLTAVVPLGQSIGRWGNFFNSEAFGRPVTDSFPLKLYIAPEHRPDLLHNFNYFHPTFLYESIWDLWLFIVLYFFVADRLRKYPGMSSCVYLAGYSLGRVIVESIRIDSIMYFGMQVPLLVSGASLALALVGMLVLILKYRRTNAATTSGEASS